MSLDYLSIALNLDVQFRCVSADSEHYHRIILTFDLDFSELLAISRENLPSVMIFRLQKTIPHFVADRLLKSLPSYKENLIQGAILLIEDSRYRLRHLPI